jgi:stage III sporulation protein AD
MELYIKAIVGALIALLLCLTLGSRGKEMSLLLALLVCAMVVTVGMSYLGAVIKFFTRLQETIGLDNDLLGILLKAVGVGLIGEIAGMICADAGQAALSKAVQILTAAVILWIALPLYTQMLDIIEDLLTGI